MKLKERINSLFGECNVRLLRAYTQVRWCYGNYVGPMENGVLDNGEDSDEGKSCIKAMQDTEGLREYLYQESFFGNTIYSEGGCHWGKACEMHIKDLRFIGEENMRVIVDWVLAMRNKEADYPCDWSVEKFNEAHPNFKQEA